MTIAQRGTSFTGVSVFQYTLDRMKVIISYTGGSTNVTQQADAPDADSKYSISYTHATANTSSISNYCNRQSIETSNVVDLAGSSVTVSFWYKSSRTGNHAIVVSPVGTTGGSATTTTFTVTSANTWEYKTVTSTAFIGVTAWGTDNAEGAFIDVGFNCGGTGQSAVSSGDYFAISRLQLEVGVTATSFDYRSIGTELALCQRYYEQYNITGGSAYGTGGSTISNQCRVMIPFLVQKRATPSFSSSATSTFQVQTNNVNNSVSGLTMSGGSFGQAAYIFAITTITLGAAGTLVDSTNSFLAFSSEL
jgi:hypothetical protein